MSSIGHPIGLDLSPSDPVVVQPGQWDRKQLIHSCALVLYSIEKRFCLSLKTLIPIRMSRDLARCEKP